ncbi:hypothetical protein B0T17DRAFT_490430 [Bombardia bombarda]|uniref:Uncharacterized protein n=1 Tax=Bombardia bombarda TaxID=252184 RepID=A0AA39XBN3_9PEZI|nr:hypothetical protein B0T17DRAFT_490430 [Bombardia bombarda]
MTIVFLAFSVCGCILPGTEQFYRKRLRCAADLLNRHMSIGFTIPFVMVCRSQVADSRTIGLIIVCFILTSIITTISAYTLALPIQYLMVRWDRSFCGCSPLDMTVTQGVRPSVPQTTAKSIPEVKIMASVESMSNYGSESEESTDDEGPNPPQMKKVPSAAATSLPSYDWARRNPMLVICWLFTITIGLPLRYAAGNNAVFATGLLFALWLTMLAIQVDIKSSQQLRPWLRTLLAGIFNPVLWTSLGMMAYIFIDGAVSRRSLSGMLDTLQRDTTFSTFILRLVKHASSAVTTTGASSASPSIGAGDIAVSILNAGLVSWGLKLYEYRGHLVSRGGLTVFVVSLLLALGNMVLGPLFVHAIGLRPAGRELAFAARTVTIALGSPVMAVLGGDAGLNAAMVVLNGILFQMGLGFGVGRWLEKKLPWLPTATTTPTNDVEAQKVVKSTNQCTTKSDETNDPYTVAAGVTIGINSAAMGTAYLYETKSDAAPYSALSMMALGIMTVGIAAIKPLTVWLVERVAN